jgi:hypothetical protein
MPATPATVRIFNTPRKSASKKTHDNPASEASDPRPVKKRRLLARSKITRQGGRVEKAILPDTRRTNDRKALLIGSLELGVHLRVGLYPESYERTKLPNTVDVEVAPMPDGRLRSLPSRLDKTERVPEVIVIDDDETEEETEQAIVINDDTEDEVEDAVVSPAVQFRSVVFQKTPGVFRRGKDAALMVDQIAVSSRVELRRGKMVKPAVTVRHHHHPEVGADRVVPGAISPSRFDDLPARNTPKQHQSALGAVDGLSKYPPDTLTNDLEQQAQNLAGSTAETSEPDRNANIDLPPVVFITRADAKTRLRYDVEVLTINGEKYVRVDETHFLYAFNATILMQGENVTIRRKEFAGWGPDRHDSRPEILFKLYPQGQYAYTLENDRRRKAPHEFRPELDSTGRVVLNGEDKPLKHSAIMPITVSTEIGGWEMEAICRLDPDICHQDFIDRMLPAGVLRGKKPAKGTLNHRRRRDRMRMRILPWPVPSRLSYSDQQVVNEMSPRQLQRNSTRGLRDLSKEEIDLHEAITYGGHLERSGSSKALNDQARLDQMRSNLALVRSKFAEGSDEVKMVKERVEQLLKKMGLEGAA